MKLSIIIPVYNVEKYLVKCLDSCVYQKVDKNEYEIVVVNDGSTDGSGLILQTYDWKGCNHTLIEQKNQGLSVARNTGASAAKGDYIWFVDSDDWISDDSLSIIFPLLGEVDVVCQRSYIKSFESKDITFINNKDFESGPEFLKHKYDVMAVLYIYRRKFFLDLGFVFEPNIYHEDTHFTPRAIYLSNKICCINSPLYYYRQREGSIMSQHNPKKVYDQIKILNDLYVFCDSSVAKEDRKGWIGQLMSGPILNLLWIAKAMDDKTIKRDVKTFLNSNIRYTMALVYSPFFSIKALGFFSLLLLGNLDLAYSILYVLKKRH